MLALRRSLPVLRQTQIVASKIATTNNNNSTINLTTITLRQYSDALTRMVSNNLTSQLRALLQDSEILTPDTPNYEDSIKRWNVAIEKRAPIVVRPRTSTDIPATLSLVSEHRLPLAIHAGGHFTAPTSSTSVGLVLSLSHLNHVTIDTQAQTATVQAGATAGDVTRAAAEHGLAAVVPNVSKVGFVGATLCGGLGHLTGQHGLMVDQVVSAKVALADGRVVTASEGENRDLFWAVRGAGGMVGVVMEVTVRLHKLRNEKGLVFAGALMYSLNQLEELVEAVNRTAPDASGRGNLLLVLAAPPPTLTPMLIVSVFYDGSEEEARAFFARLYEVKPMMDYAGMMPVEKSGTLVDWTADMGRRQFMGSGAIETPLQKVILAKVVQMFEDFMKRSPEGMAAEVLFPFTGLEKVGSVKEQESAFPCRGGKTQQVMVVVNHLNEGDDGAAKEFVDDVEAYLRGELSQAAARELSVYTGYDNNRTDAERVFGSSRAKQLQEVKAKYDPANLFDKWYPLK